MYFQSPILNQLDINKAIFLSVIIHALLLINLQWSSVKVLSEPVIEINLQKKKIKSEVSQPNPPPIEKPKLKPKPFKKSLPVKNTVPIKKEIPLPLPTPIIQQNNEQTPSEDLVEQRATNINPQLVDDYSSKLRVHIEKYKRYPRMAQIRGWNGEVIIQAEINGNGALISSKVLRSSGRSILDKEGLAMMQRSIPFPIPPKVLNNNSFKITIPISFSLI
jgi:protein TonB